MQRGAADAAALAARAEALAREIAGHAPLTLRATKRSLRRLAAAAADDYADVLETYLSADFARGWRRSSPSGKPVWRASDRRQAAGRHRFVAAMTPRSSARPFRRPIAE